MRPTPLLRLNRVLQTNDYCLCIIRDVLREFLLFDTSLCVYVCFDAYRFICSAPDFTNYFSKSRPQKPLLCSAVATWRQRHEGREGIGVRARYPTNKRQRVTACSVAITGTTVANPAQTILIYYMITFFYETVALKTMVRYASFSPLFSIETRCIWSTEINDFKSS